MTHYQVIIQRTPNQSGYDGLEKAYLDTYSDESISLNYNIADITNLGNKNSSYSKTINFPNTRNNQAVFTDIWSVNLTNSFANANSFSFNVNTKVKAWILKDNVIQFEGNLQLTNIVYDYVKNTIVYQCVIYSENDGLFKSIGESYLSDLDLIRYNHSWTAQNVIASWTASYGNGYYYPMIDYGIPLSRENTFRTTYFYPAWYVKTIWDQIFTEAGYSYRSEFLDDDYFNHLIIPYSNKGLPGAVDLTFNEKKEVLKITQVAEKKWSFTASTPNTTIGNYQYLGSYFWHGGYMIGDTLNYDPNGFYSLANSWYQNPPDQRFAQRIEINIGLLSTKLMYQNGQSKFGTSNPPGGRRNNYGDFYIKILRSRNSSNFGPTGSAYNVFNIANQTNTNPPTPQDKGWEVITFGGLDHYSFKNNPQGLLEGQSPTTGEWQYAGKIVSDVIQDPLTFEENEKIMIWFGRSRPLAFVSESSLGSLVSSEFRVEQLQMTVIYEDSINVEGGKIAANKTLPNMKQKDFIVNIMKMFNLYIDEDKEIPKSFLIEPRDVYYEKYGTTKDWSDKLDLSKPINSQIASNLQSRTQLLTYKEDKDFYNTEYKNQTGTIFGEYKFEFDNEFAAGENKIELMFSPTPMNRLPLSNAMMIPSIYGFNNGNLSNLGGFNTRILYAETQGCTAGDIWRMWTNGYNVGTSSTFSIYPFASFADDPFEPENSLNFGTILATSPNYTETINNLYYNYYQNTFLEINSPDARIIEAYFNLTPYDINKFTFADLVYCSFGNMGDYYRVTKIMDYDPSKYEPTKVQMIKALNFKTDLGTFDPCDSTLSLCLEGVELSNYLTLVNSYYGGITPYLTWWNSQSDFPDGYYVYNITSSSTTAQNIVDWINTNGDGNFTATYSPGLTQCVLNFEVEMGEEAANIFVGTLNDLWDNSPENGGSGPDPYIVIYINYPCGATFGTWDEYNNTYFWDLSGYNDQYTFLDWWLANIPGAYGTASGEILAEGAYLKLGWDWVTSCTQSATCSGECLQLYIAESSVNYLPGGWTPDLFVSSPVLGPTSGPVFDAGGLTYAVCQDICECSDESLCFYWNVISPCGESVKMSNAITTAIGTEVEELIWESAPILCECNDTLTFKVAYLKQSTGFRAPIPLANNTYVGVINTSSDNFVFAPNNIVLGRNTSIFAENNIVIGNDNGNVVGNNNLLLGNNLTTTDDSDSPSVLIGNNITSNISGAFLFGNDISISDPIGTTSSTYSIPSAENVFVIGSNLSLGGSQSLLPNTTYLGTENIIISQDGGFNTPFIISEAVNTDEIPSGQTIIKTYTGLTPVILASTTYYVFPFTDGTTPNATGVNIISWDDIRDFSVVQMEFNIRVELFGPQAFGDPVASYSNKGAWVKLPNVSGLPDFTLIGTDAPFFVDANSPLVTIDIPNTIYNIPLGIAQPSIEIVNGNATEGFVCYYDITIKYQYSPGGYYH